MNPDNPETLSLDESEWDETQMEDVFVPSVRVQLGWADVEAAVQRGEIVPAAAYALWAHWASPGSPTRQSSDVAASMDPHGAPPAAQGHQPVAGQVTAIKSPSSHSPLALVGLAVVSALVGAVISTVALLISAR